MNTLNEFDDLALVYSVVFESHNLIVQRFSNAELNLGPTPDWRVYLDDNLVAYCEVKSPRDDWMDDQFNNASRGELVGGLRSDPTFNRLARHISKAVCQFDAVNHSRSVPNILVFVNHDEQTDYCDLRETLTGDFFSDDGKRYPTNRRIAEQRLGDDRYLVDLYLWIDAPKRKVSERIFSEANSSHVDSICKMLKLDPLKIAH
jgi:hypothetical protein